MPEHVRVGVIGTSWWADMMHLPSLASHPGAELVAICGRNRERAEEMADKYEITEVFADYQEMIEKGNLQAVVVSAPDDLHYPMTMAALDAGLHVMCEKPLALNVHQAREMTEKAEAAGVKHMVLFTWRWVPYMRYLLKLIEEDQIGRCFHGHFHWMVGYGRGGNYGWKWDRHRGLGILGDLGSHLIDIARCCMGEIAKVSANLANFVERPGPDGRPIDPANDSALLTLQFANGSQGAIHASAVAHLGSHHPEQQFVLHGEAGTLEVEFCFGGQYTVRRTRHDEKQAETLPIPSDILEGLNANSPSLEWIGQLFTEQAAGDRLFIDAILKDRPVSPSFYDGLAVQKVIDAAIESHEKGIWVELE
ncbi:MAG: Gfo/Idh/MocA family oxidoreductase [Gemmatimonadetes bacterium]|jgi:predicted dehydrogenase|nr:Gfo/Idh/MocA family oxidoreductase [Gemmatimonadota bacterium]MBT7915158.1 Gfo/Idh/MocA family oxidoreductase [Candidatus Bathyarchaeota archaeon]